MPGARKVSHDREVIIVASWTFLVMTVGGVMVLVHQEVAVVVSARYEGQCQGLRQRNWHAQLEMKMVGARTEGMRVAAGLGAVVLRRTVSVI